MVDKKILIQYANLKEELRDIRAKIQSVEDDIARIEEEGTVKDIVSGGMGGTQHFRIEGFPYKDYSKKKELLRKRHEKLEDIEVMILNSTIEVETFISSIPDSRMRRIINYRFMEGKSWYVVARMMGGKCTADSIRMEFERFLKNF